MKSGDVYLLFFFKKCDDRADQFMLEKKNLFSVPIVAYYFDLGRYLEFCVELVKDFCQPSKKVLSVCTSTKFMIATMVSMIQVLF